MDSRRPIFRASLIALAAIAGMLLAADGVAAASFSLSTSTTRGDRTPQMRHAGCCCIVRPASGCCCEPAAAPASATIVAATHRVDAGSESTRGPCQCRAGEPLAPGGQPGPRPPEGREDPGRAANAGVVAIGGPVVHPWSVRPVAATARPPRSPLYLLNARLLI